MQKQINARRLWRIASGWLRNMPLVALTVTVSLAMEAFGWAYIFMTNHETSTILNMVVSLALIEATIISASGLLALLASFVAAERRNDPRPEVRRSAIYAQVLACALLVGPILKAADGFAYPQQVAAAEAFRNSAQYTEMLAASRDMQADPMERRIARANLERGITPPRAKIDATWFGCFLFAAFLYGCNMAAASLLWRVRSETPAERERRERREAREARDKRARLEHELELQRLRAKKRPVWFRGLFGKAA